MTSELGSFIEAHGTALQAFVGRIAGRGVRSLVQAEVQEALRESRAVETALADSPLERIVAATQEAVTDGSWVFLAVRERPGRFRYLRLHAEITNAEHVDAAEYLSFKERLARQEDGDPAWPLEIDFGPFNAGRPMLRETRSIGHGLRFLNSHLSSRLFRDAESGGEALLGFLRRHAHDGRTLLLNDRIEDTDALRRALREADALLSAGADETPWPAFAHALQELGFEPGWGDTAHLVQETMELLSALLEAPDSDTTERFLARIPLVFRVVTISPHGFVGQGNVLGRPDTGGQVVYILDQVRALEREMRRRLARQGLDIEPRIVILTRLIPESEGTTCSVPREAVLDTETAVILRVPFRTERGEIVPEWISRFHVWPFLEGFALEAEREILAELGGRPDLVIGNYSDGNTVATILARRMQVLQCAIAHALEKNKYPGAALHWRDFEADYRFSAQFTADLIAMNAADFLVTGTRQEIAGTDGRQGQYETYSAFTMPGLVRVVNGIDIFDPRFNVISPGTDESTFFPYTETERRPAYLQAVLDRMVFGGPGDTARGMLADPGRPIVFTLSRLDHNKNVSGLVEWFAGDEALRERANLLIVTGHVDAGRSSDAEERDEIARMHRLIDDHGLDDCVRWVGLTLPTNLVGELYRFVADRRGVFVQPGWFELFGLTIIESMVSGLPTFATNQGGPQEIIEDGVCGFSIDPYRGAEGAERIRNFLDECAANPSRWTGISTAGIRRVRERYTWSRHAERLVTLTNVVSFWSHVSDLGRAETDRYLDALYALLWRGRANGLPVPGTATA